MSSRINSEQEKLLKELLEEAGLSEVKRGRYYFSNGEVKSTLSTLLKKLRFPDTLKEKEGLKDLALDYFTGDFPDREFEKIAQNYSYEKNPETEISRPSSEISVSMKERIAKLAPLVDASRNAKERIILVDPENGDRPVWDVSTEVYMAITGMKMGEILCSDEIAAVYPTYNPYRHEAIFEDYDSFGELLPYINYHIPPKWHSVDVKASYGGRIKTLIEHVFTDEKERERVLDWMHYAVTKKNGTVLCLAGSRGIGKTLVTNSVLANLLGKNNMELVNSEILSEKFNSAFKHRRLLMFEEVEITSDKAINKFKAFCNDRIVVEEKGRDSETINSYANMVVMLNNLAQLKIMPQERRFSIPCVTEKPLTDVMSKAEIGDFVNDMEDPYNEELAAFGKFLQERVPQESELEPIKGKYYFRVSGMALEDWKCYMLEFLAEPQEVVEFSVKEFKKKYQRDRDDREVIVPTKPALYDSFFMDFKYEGVCQVGRIVPSSGRNSFKIAATEEFVEYTKGKIARGEPIVDRFYGSLLRGDVAEVISEGEDKENEEMQGGDEENLL